MRVAGGRPGAADGVGVAGAGGAPGAERDVGAGVLQEGEAVAGLVPEMESAPV
jgi:hypothetical protein